MERQSNLHNPRLDDELAHEVESLTRGAPIEARVDESRLMEDAGDGEPVVEHAPFSLRFGFRFESKYRLAALPFGVSPSSAHVDVRSSAGGERSLTAHFGPWTVTTPVSNVLSTASTGPYGTLKTIGPAHVSLRDLGLTFATNRERGLCIRFRRAVPGLAPTGLIRHPALTVTVDDPDGLARVLAV